ncbi:MAG: zinc ribbon domain-containing protein [Halobacteriales archaeon]
MRDSKITFRVSDDLLERVDAIDESRSEIMREALRSYLDGSGGGVEREPARATYAGSGFDAMLTRKIESVVERKLDDREMNVTVNLPESYAARAPSRSPSPASSYGGAYGGAYGRAPARGQPEEVDAPGESPVETEGGSACPQCGEHVEEDHVHCPNCGAKASQRVFCECGDEVRTDWSFCPSCGRRTPSGHALTR